MGQSNPSRSVILILLLSFFSYTIQSSVVSTQENTAAPPPPGPPCADNNLNNYCDYIHEKPRRRKWRCRKYATEHSTYADYCPLTCRTCTGWTSERIHVSNFGAVGDSHTNDTLAILRAISYANSRNDTHSKAGGTVYFGRGVYRTYTPLIIPDGVKLVGEGYGTSPLQIKFGGSVIAYCGTDHAVVLAGHNAGIERMAVYDWRYGDYCSTVDAAGGILVQADGRLIESVVVRNVFVYHFMGGTALTLHARNQGGIGFGSYNDLRLRHAKVGIHLLAEEGSFVNENTFRGGCISGRVVESAVIADEGGPCNGNKFHDMTIEPPKTLNGHVIVRGYKTNVQMMGIRLEGTEQDPLTPMVNISNGSYGNVLDGIIGHTFVSADFNLNPDVKFLTQKGTSIRPNSQNAFGNSAFHSVTFDTDGTASIPMWVVDDIEDASVALASSAEEIFPNHRVLAIGLNSTTATRLKLRPSSLKVPAVHKSCSFGIYARTSVPRGIVATMFAPSKSMVSSSGHSGSGEWEFIGISSLFRAQQDGGPFPVFYLYGDVEVSAPTLSFGTVPPAPGFEPISASGGIMTGTLSMGMAVVPPPPEGTFFWNLPQEGNIFQMGDLGGDTRRIDRINNSGSIRFPVGTLVTILLPEVGVSFRHSNYIKLKGNVNFNPSLPNSSITLASLQYGTWAEVNRNE